MQKYLFLLLLLLATSFLPAQSYQWALSEGGPDYLEFATGVAPDKDGNVYMCGWYYSGATIGDSTYTSFGSSDNAIVKYDPNGNALWTLTLGSPSPDQNYSIYAADDGSVFVAGYGKYISGWKTTPDFHSRDAIMMRIFPNGQPDWAHAVDGDVYSEAADVVADANGNSYFTGHHKTVGYFGNDTLIGAGQADVFVNVFTPGGTLSMLTGFGGTGEDEPLGIDIDAAGNIYVAGFYSGEFVFGPDTLKYTSGTEGFLVKMSPNGTPIWAHGFHGPGNDRVDALAVSPSGNVYIACRFASTLNFDGDTLTATGDDFVVAKFDANGNRIWNHQTTAASIELCEDLEIDEDENVYVAGFYYGPFAFGSGTATNGGLEDGFFMKLDSTGALQHLSTHSFPETDFIFDLGVDKAQNIYLAGGYTGTIALGADTMASVGGSHDMLVAKYGMPLAITLDSVTGTPFCANDVFELHYSVYGAADSGNVFIAQLSDPSGSFASPTTIGMASHPFCGSIISTIPTGIPAGIWYRVRVASTTPAATSNDNGADITLTVVSAVPMAINGPTCVDSGSSITLMASSGFASYLWSTGDTTQNIQVSSPGTYTVEGTDSSGCTNSADQVVDLCVSLTETTLQRKIKVYPNPTSGRFTLDYGDQGPPCDQVRMLDARGRNVREWMICPDSASQFTFEMDGLPNGIYFLLIPHQDGPLSKKIILNRP